MSASAVCERVRVPAVDFLVFSIYLSLRVVLPHM